MKTYSITYNKGSREVPCAERLPQCSDVYRFTVPSWTPGGSYDAGDTLLIIERTGFTPHHLLSSLGNLLVKSKHHVSVWTNIEWAIWQGTLELVKEGK